MSKQYKMKGHQLPGPNQRAQSGDTPLESFDWKAAVSGGAKGAVSGSVAGPWGAAAMGLFKGIKAGIAGGKENDQAEAAADLATKSAEEKDALLLKAKESLEQGNAGYSEEQV